MRTAFERLGQSYIDIARSLTPEDLDRHGLGEWSVRELLGHALRAFSTAAAYLDAPATVDRRVSSVRQYYVAAMSIPGIHASVADRGRAAGADLGDEPATTVERTVNATRARVGAADDDAEIKSIVGQMPLVPYLATRVVEAGVHLLDLQRALGAEVGIDPLSAEIILTTLVETADATDLILALTGRVALPVGYNVLG